MTLIEIVGNLYVRTAMLEEALGKLQAEQQQLVHAVTTLQSEETAARVAEEVFKNLVARPNAPDMATLIHAELNKPVKPAEALSPEDVAALKSLADSPDPGAAAPAEA